MSQNVKTNTKMSPLYSCQNLNEQEYHDGGKGKRMRAKGQKSKRAQGQKDKRAKGQKPQTIIFPLHPPKGGRLKCVHDGNTSFPDLKVLNLQILDQIPSLFYIFSTCP